MMALRILILLLWYSSDCFSFWALYMSISFFNKLKICVSYYLPWFLSKVIYFNLNHVILVYLKTSKCVSKSKIQTISVSFDPAFMSIYLFRVNITCNEIPCDGTQLFY
jgi:hypothetical protein